jgi:threonine synthase
LIDPHTAVGVAAAYNLGENTKGPKVVLSTAHPAKFPEAVRRATGEIPPPPPRLKGVMTAQEKMTVLSAEKGLVRAFIESTVPQP